MVLLDTCTLLWLVSDQRKLSKKAKEAVKQHSDSLFVSSISAFEIAIRSRQRKLELPMSPLEWFVRSLEFHGIHEIPVSSEIAANSVSLPPLHNDPCDRIIIARNIPYPPFIVAAVCLTVISSGSALFWALH